MADSSQIPAVVDAPVAAPRAAPTPPTAGSKSAQKKAEKLAKAEAAKGGKPKGEKTWLKKNTGGNAATDAIAAAKALKVNDPVALSGAVINEVLASLAALGVSVPEDVKDKVQIDAAKTVTPLLVALKNASYTSGYSSILAPSTSFAVLVKP